MRLLFIDIWRLKTGRTTLEAIGLKPKPAKLDATLAGEEIAVA